jgi:hypothetical protein
MLSKIKIRQQRHFFQWKIHHRYWNQTNSTQYSNISLYSAFSGDFWESLIFLFISSPFVICLICPSSLTYWSFPWISFFFFPSAYSSVNYCFLISLQVSVYKIIKRVTFLRPQLCIGLEWILILFYKRALPLTHSLVAQKRIKYWQHHWRPSLTPFGVKLIFQNEFSINNPKIKRTPFNKTKIFKWVS